MKKRNRPFREVRTILGQEGNRGSNQGRDQYLFRFSRGRRLTKGMFKDS
ncbi:MAG: hypothetical protein R6U96_08530 [Promethearchaeia archaeon]